MSMESYLPIKVETFKGEDEAPTNDVVVLGEITDDDDDEMGFIQIAFTLKGFRHFLGFRKLDLRNALAAETGVDEK